MITTRDGYCVSLSNELAARLRLWRRDPRSCCGRGWGPLIWVLERIGASSARPVGQEYLAPYHMRVGEGWVLRGRGAGWAQLLGVYLAAPVGLGVRMPCGAPCSTAPECGIPQHQDALSAGGDGEAGQYVAP